MEKGSDKEVSGEENRRGSRRREEKGSLLKGFFQSGENCVPNLSAKSEELAGILEREAHEKKKG
ncbi:hypothetical protein [Thermoanaerobacterium sp. DL9XJH110]|uniref:hypothetical protein n=1 Tax=Thermoanaerobacterium sp. DL9XJH110 TaxID=3386643 RepID=UPI003BB579B9